MDTKIFELIAGAVMPPAIDLINREIANSNVRFVISMVVCLVLGAIFNLGKLNPGDILASGAIIFAAAQTVYKTYYYKSNVRAEIFGEGLRGKN